MVEKFQAKEEYDHLFLPVKMPSKLYKAMKSSVTKKRDYLFNRQELERSLYNASADLCAAVKPLIEAVSLLDDRPGCGDIKCLIGQGILGLLSSNIKISKGRRELGRRFVRLDCAEALFSVAPSHHSLFGGKSDSAAVTAAKEATKLDDSLVHKPKFKRPFRPSYSTNAQGQGFQQASGYRGRGGRAPYLQSYSQPRSSQNQQQQQSANPRGRGRGGKNNYSNYKSSRKSQT